MTEKVWKKIEESLERLEGSSELNKIRKFSCKNYKK